MAWHTSTRRLNTDDVIFGSVEAEFISTGGGDHHFSMTC